MATAFVSYYPSDLHAARFWESQHLAQDVAPRVPVGFPEQLNSPLAWRRSDLESRLQEFVVNLSEDDIEALEHVLAEFEAQPIHLSDISRDNFVLPTDLVARLKSISNQCYHGVGFSVVHGLDPTKYTPEQNVILYAAVAAHVAPQHGFLDKAYEKVMCHVVNAASAAPIGGDDKTPGFTSGPLAFHSDNCEILALYALDVAAERGKTLVSSSFQLYNELAKKRPDVLQTLADEWVLDSFNDYAKFPPKPVPFLHNAPGEDKVVFRFSRYPITGFNRRKRNAALPAPTSAQIEAIDAVQFMAAANSIALPWGRGDIAFINDMAILHARESFNERGRHLQRHLLKFYLRDPEQNWPIPETAKETWKKTYGPNMPDGTRREEWLIHYEAGQEDSWQTNG